MSQSNSEQPNIIEESSKTFDPTTRRADALVRAGSPDPAQGLPPMSPTTEPSNHPDGNRGHCVAVPPPSSSHGPKTPEGKAISSANATTHGLRAKKLENAVSPAMRQQYEKLRSQYQDDYRPAGAIENTLFDMLVFAAWQLYKIRDLEMFDEIDLGLMGSFGRSEKLARYRGSHERLLFRSLNQLKQIQQERLLRETDQKAAIPANLPPGVRLKPLRDHLKRLHRHPKTRTAGATRIPEAANAKSGCVVPAANAGSGSPKPRQRPQKPA